MNDKKSFIAGILPEAAKRLANKFSRKFDYTDKKGYLAEAESSVHEFIEGSILDSFPDSFVYSEEGKNIFSGVRKKNSYIWVLDPICGTANFIKDVPFYAHSLSVLDDTGVLCAGIYDSNRDELFMADGIETTLNGKKISVSETKKLDEAFVSVNCNQSAWMDKGAKIDELVNKFMPPVSRRVRILESANLELAYVACGRLDAYVNPEDKIWDIAAGSLMIALAGGRTKIMQGSILELDKCRGIAASNQFLMDSLLRILYA